MEEGILCLNKISEVHEHYDKFISLGFDKKTFFKIIKSIC